MNIRRIEVHDLTKVLACNLSNLPENYPMRFWVYVILTWPDLSFLAEDDSGKVVGYVLSSIEPAEGDPHTQVGYVNSLSVLRPYRRLGLAQKLMDLTTNMETPEDAMMREDVTIGYLQLHVRKSNRAAHSLYNKLGYTCHSVDEKYYDDGEDAWVMRFPIQPESPSQRQERLRFQSPTRETCLTNLWHFLHDKSWMFIEAATGLLRRRNSRQ